MKFNNLAGTNYDALTRLDSSDSRAGVGKKISVGPEFKSQ